MSESTADINYLSHHAANACIYVSYVVFLLMGLTVAFIYRKKGEFLAGHHTRKHFFLGMNFLASGTYIATYGRRVLHLEPLGVDG